MTSSTPLRLSPDYSNKQLSYKQKLMTAGRMFFFFFKATTSDASSIRLSHCPDPPLSPVPVWSGDVTGNILFTSFFDGAPPLPLRRMLNHTSLCRTHFIYLFNHYLNLCQEGYNQPATARSGGWG